MINDAYHWCLIYADSLLHCRENFKSSDKNLEESKMSDRDRIKEELKKNWKGIEKELKKNWKKKLKKRKGK